jgi:hypothetical protein
VLSSFWCANNPNLKTIYAKNGANESFVLGNNPNLQFVCVDDSQVDAVRTYLDGNSLANVACSSYCSFTPGGNYNTITGIARFDGNSNGCDATDLTPNNIRFNISDAQYRCVVHEQYRQLYLLYTNGQFHGDAIGRTPYVF